MSYTYQVMQSLTSCNLSPPKCLIKPPQSKNSKLQQFESIPRQLASYCAIWANLLQPPETLPSSCFKVVQLDPIFGTFAGQSQSFSKGSYISSTISQPKRSRKTPQKVTGIWGHVFCWVFLCGFRGNKTSAWMLDSEKVFKGYCRSLEAPRDRGCHDVSTKRREWCRNHDVFFWWRFGWFGSRKFGVEIVKTKWLSHVLTWEKMKRSFKDLYVETQWLWYESQFGSKLANRMAWTFSATQREPSYCKPSFFVWIDSADKGIKFRVTSNITQWFDKVISCNHHLYKNPTNIWHICGRYYVCNIVYKFKRKKVIQCLHMFVSWSQKNTISWTIPSPSHLDNISSKHSWLQRHEVPTLSKTLKLMTFASTSFCLKKEAVFWRFWVNLIHWKWMKEQMLGARKCSV